MDNLGPELTQYWDFDPNSFQLLAARENTIYCAETAQGKIVIRKHRTGYQDAAGIESELCLMHAMKAANCSVPDAIAAKDNRFVIAHDGGSFHGDQLGFGTNDVGCFVIGPQFRQDHTNLS